MSVDSDLAWLEARKAALLEALAAEAAAATEAPRTAGGWSLLDVANHLMRVEQYAATQFDANRKTARRRRLRDRARFALMRMVLASPIRVRVPVKEVDPTGQPISREALETTWADLRRRLRATAETLAPEAHEVAFLDHPLGGRMRLGDGVAFLVDHWRNHERQIRALEDGAGGLPR